MEQSVWMLGPEGGPPQEVEATPDVLVPLLVQGWSQCEAPVAAPKKSKEKVIHGEPA